MNMFNTQNYRVADDEVNQLGSLSQSYRNVGIQGVKVAPNANNQTTHYEKIRNSYHMSSKYQNDLKLNINSANAKSPKLVAGGAIKNIKIGSNAEG
jgi:predicted DNA-binding protein (MmcQ/YjbR family)